MHEVNGLHNLEELVGNWLAGYQLGRQVNVLQSENLHNLFMDF